MDMDMEGDGIGTTASDEQKEGAAAVVVNAATESDDRQRQQRSKLSLTVVQRRNRYEISPEPETHMFANAQVGNFDPRREKKKKHALPIRLLEDFDVRDKQDEKALVALTSAIKTSDLIVFGKARKVEGGENLLPSVLLKEKLQPQLKPPHALKLVDVLDWCVSYDEVGSESDLKQPGYSIWLVTPRAWYKLGQPGVKYAATYATTRRRALFASVFKRCLEKDWECSFTTALEAMKNAPRVEFDVRQQKNSNKNSSIVKDDKDKENDDDENKEEENDETDDDDDDDDDDEFSYSENEIKRDGFFVCSQIEHLIKSGVLLPPGSESSQYGQPYNGKLPWCLISFSRWTMIANQLAKQRKDRAEMEHDRKERQKLRDEERAKRKEQKLAEKEAAKKARELALKEKNKPIVVAPRIADPSKCSRAIEEFPWASPAIVGEVLSLWDITSVYETVFHVPTTTLKRFARAFLSKSSECTPTDALVVQDVIIGAIRAIEARADAVDLAETMRRNSKMGFTDARSVRDETIGLQDLASLNWRQLAIENIEEHLPMTPCNARIRTGARLAIEKLQELMLYDADNVITADLEPSLRVCLASALVIIAADSEGFHENEMDKLDEIREKKRQALGIRAFDVGIPIVIPEHLLRIPVAGAKLQEIKEKNPKVINEVKEEEKRPVVAVESRAPHTQENKQGRKGVFRCGDCHTCNNPRLRQKCRNRPDEIVVAVEPKKEQAKKVAAEEQIIIDDPNLRRPKDDNEKRMLWTRQAARWYRDNDDRQIFRHGRPVAQDMRGRRYFQLGGRNGSGMLFVESPLPSWFVSTPKPKEEKKEKKPSPAKSAVTKEKTNEDHENMREDNDDDDDDNDEDSEGEEEKEVKSVGPPVDDGEYTDNYLIDLPVADDADRQINMSVDGVYEAASNWGVVYPNEELFELANWCDPNYVHEKYICRWANLVSRSVLGETYDNVTSEKLAEEETREKFKEFLKSIDGEYDGYSKIEENSDGSRESVFGNSHAKALKLVSVAQYLLHSTPFWVQDYNWTEKFIACDQELTNIIEHAPESVVLKRLMQAFLQLENCCRTSKVMDPSWHNSRQSWMGKVKKFIKNSPGEGGPNDEYDGGDEEMMDDDAVEVSLNVTSAAALLHKLVVLQLTDPARLSAHTFAFSDTEGLAKHASKIKTGDVVMLCMKGYKETKRFHLSDELIPPHFVDTALLRNYERCIVKATAFRGQEEHDDGHVDEPWAWFLLELIDEPSKVEMKKTEQIAASKNSKKKTKKKRKEPADSDEEFELGLIVDSSSDEDVGDEVKRRLLACPLIPSGQIGDYIVTLEQYERGKNYDWKVGDKVMMHFPDGEVFDDFDRGIIEDENEKDPGKKIKYLGEVTKVKKDDPFDGVSVVWKSESIDAEKNGGKVSPTAVSAWELERAPLIIRKTNPSADRNLMAYMREPMPIFKPTKRDRQIGIAPSSDGRPQICLFHRFDVSKDVRRLNSDVYGPANGKIASPYLTRTGTLMCDPTPFHMTNEMVALKKQGVELALKWGWNEAGVRKQVHIDAFNKLREKLPLYHDGNPHRNTQPSFCREPLDLYGLFVEALHQGGYNAITREKNWKAVCRGLRVDLSGQTSASFSLRVKYEVHIRDVEYLARELAPKYGCEKFEYFLRQEEKKPDRWVSGFTAVVREKENQQWREIDILKNIITRAQADKETEAIRAKYAKRFPDLFKEELLQDFRDSILKDEPAVPFPTRMIYLHSVLDKTSDLIEAAQSEDPEDYKHYIQRLKLERALNGIEDEEDVKMEDSPPPPPPKEIATTKKKRKNPEPVNAKNDDDFSEDIVEDDEDEYDNDEDEFDDDEDDSDFEG